MSRASFLRLACTTIAVLAPVASAAAADGPTKAQCLAADDAAQPLRKDGKFAAAREQLRVCDAPACPALVRSDCTRMMEELERAQPTVVFDVKDEQGNDLTDVRITVDGTVLTDKLTGTSLQADPGQHVFTFEAPGKPAVSRTLVLHEGEKDRHERIAMGPAPQQAPTATPASAPQPASATTPAPMTESASTGSSGWGTRRWIAVGLGAAGVAGLAAGGVFGALALSAKNAQQSDCASPTSCSDYSKALSDHSTLSTDATISTIAFIGGGALLAAGAVLFFTSGSSASPTTGVVVAPAVGAGGAGVTMQARF